MELHKNDRPIVRSAGDSYQAKSGFVKRTVAGETLLVPVGEATRDLNGMVLLNETGAFLWDELQTPKREEALVQAVLSAFEVDEASARTDVSGFVQDGVRNGLIQLL